MDWNVISSVATAFASVATAIGVLFCGIQLKIAKKQGQAEFEDKLDQQYRTIAMALPVDVLIGKTPSDDNAGTVRELIFNYLDLSNEQIYLRAKGRVSRHTWNSWKAGISAHMSKKAFRAVFEEVQEISAFTYLSQLDSDHYESDPIAWFR